MAHPFPKIIYGTAWKREHTADLIVKAVKQGFRAIDTACQPKHYREDLVGSALGTLYESNIIKREDLFLQTKYTPIGGQDRSQPIPYDPSDAVQAQVRASFSTSLRNLRTTYLDGYLLHSPLNTDARTLEAWRTLVALRDEGKVRLIGVSNVYDVRVLRLLAAEGGSGVDIVQNRWYEGNVWDGDVVEYCRNEGIHYESFWTLSGSPSLLQHPSILSISRKLSCTPAQAIFRLAQEWGVTPLAGSKNEGHMKDGVETEKIALEGVENDVELLRELMISEVERA
ncbi:hypothetical protein BOTBODRAFT_61376 [Botryobasidium botryosum FD-172 SS1]|uniref:NADP-dependent oxidoreductase domain-containing protein n=1 Tax=Botryobasidium botryosum (strain FD-172 SS1) TaxID=930990 RepID=A0A067NCA8_BOTB1|nr:hypothetical protein BOTBODRAFT_61376 [Botryobasidium botryosum FD-172 SS1]